MQNIPAILLFALMSNANLFGQTNFPGTESPSSINSTGYSGTGANYDVKYEKMALRVSPDSALYLKGSVQTNFLTIQSNVTAISFDLNSVFTVDSVYYEESKLPSANITRSGNVLNIALGVSLPINTYDSVRIYYKGVPPYYGGPEGFRKLNTGASNGNYNYMMSVAESYQDRDWWPCKADMQDKIDTMEFKINVPWAYPAAADTFWIVANGMLLDSTITGNDRTFTYRTSYPIASYLVGISVGRFNHYYRGTVNINGTNVPVIYNLLLGRTPAQYNSCLTAMDKMKLVLVAYSQKFGDYPFKNEKHGYYDGLVGAGGIEHQTSPCIATGSLTSLSTLAHELAHQWFGDNVTTATWNDVWLAEGFAQYCEALVGELVPSLGINPYNARNSIKTSALALSAQSAWIPNANASTSTGIWSSNYGSTIYKRGGMVVSMLRAMSGDTKFFQALTDYQAGRSGKSANTDTLKNYFNAVLGTDISPFFNDYVGGSGSAVTAAGGIGNPINTINWNSPSSNQLLVQVASQSKTAGSNVAYFHGPVVLHVKGSAAGQDTTIVFFDWGGGNLSYAGNGLSAPVAGNLLSYTLSFKPTTVLYDDSARTLSTGNIIQLTTLGVKVVNFTAHKSASGNEIDLCVVKNQSIERVLLLRSSDCVDFTELGQMNLNGNLIVSDYNYDDINTGPVTFYYKAKIVSGTNTEFTKIVKVLSSENKILDITPNPAGEMVNINFINYNRMKTIFNLFNERSQLLVQRSTNNDFLQIDSGNLSNGVYTLRMIQNNEIVQTKKLIIRH
jgi:hypothetical protein